MSQHVISELKLDYFAPNPVIIDAPLDATEFDVSGLPSRQYYGSGAYQDILRVFEIGKRAKVTVRTYGRRCYGSVWITFSDTKGKLCNLATWAQSAKSVAKTEVCGRSTDGFRVAKVQTGGLEVGSPGHSGPNSARLSFRLCLKCKIYPEQSFSIESSSPDLKRSGDLSKC